jgi:hypothetical protein
MKTKQTVASIDVIQREVKDKRSNSKILGSARQNKSYNTFDSIVTSYTIIWNSSKFTNLSLQIILFNEFNFVTSQLLNKDDTLIHRLCNVTI